MASFTYLATEFHEFARQRTDALYERACPSSKYGCHEDSRAVKRTDGGRGGTTEPSWIAELGMAEEGSGDHWYDPGGLLDSKLVRYFITDVSKIHDYMNSWNYHPDSGLYIANRGLVFDAAFQVYNASGMLPAAFLTLGAKVGQAPLQDQLQAYQISGWP